MNQIFGSLTAADVSSPLFQEFQCDLAAQAARYVGPACAVERPGSWFVSAVTNGAYQLVRGHDEELRVLSNTCPHYGRQLRVPALDWSDGYMGVLQGDTMVCAGHSWAFNSNGIHVGPSDLRVDSGPRCTHLTTHLPLTDVGGLLFSGTERQLAPMRALIELPLAKRFGIVRYVPEGFAFYKQFELKDPFSAYQGVRIFKDLNHPGKGPHKTKLDNTVDMRDPKEDYDPEHGVCIQTVRWLEKIDLAELSPHWAAYCGQILEAIASGVVDSDPYLVAWLTYYDGFFTHEKYPFMRVNSWFLPLPSGGVRNVVEFYFPDAVLEFMPELAESGVAAYLGGHYKMPNSEQPIFIDGIAQEDAQLALECDLGNKRLVEIGLGDRVVGPLDPIYDRGVYEYERYLAPRWEAYKARVSK